MVNFDKLQKLIKEKGLSQSFVSEKLGMSRNYIKDCKRLNSDLPSQRIAAIADLLGTTVEYLCDKESEIVYSAIKQYESQHPVAWQSIADATGLNTTQIGGWSSGVSDDYMGFLPELSQLLKIPEDILIGKVARHQEPTYQATALYDAFINAPFEIQEAVKNLLKIQ